LFIPMPITVPMILNRLLVLSSGGIEQIDTNVFRSHVLLRTLDLQKNKLRQLPRGMPSGLEILHLGHNRIHSLQESPLEGLKKLRVLNLQNNQISTLRTNTLTLLQRLECLYLDGNQIKSIHGVPRLPLLSLLSMGSNRIASISSTFFSSLQLLKTLDLSSNRLTKVPHGLPRSLVHLNLDRNQIRSLRNRDMSQLHNLITLSVSSNRLVSVDGGLRLPNLSVSEASQATAGVKSAQQQTLHPACTEPTKTKSSIFGRKPMAVQL
uniref:Uncharacterized protein n=1 Tax=Cyprinus carpio TaxID=7962 RepID=A0A8C2DR24_CYPCA